MRRAPGRHTVAWMVVLHAVVGVVATSVPVAAAAATGDAGVLQAPAGGRVCLVWTLPDGSESTRCFEGPDKEVGVSDAGDVNTRAVRPCRVCMDAHAN